MEEENKIPVKGKTFSLIIASRILVAIFCTFPFIAVIYKYRTIRLPDPDGYMTLAAASFFMFLCHIAFSFFVKQHNRWPLFFLHLVYFVISGIWLYTDTWYGLFNIWFIVPTAALMVVLFGTFQKEKKRDKKQTTVYIALILVVMMVGLGFTFQKLNFFRSIKNLHEREITHIRFFDYSIPIDLSTASPVLEIKEPFLLMDFCLAMGDISNFAGRSRTNNTKYIVSICKNDGTEIYMMIMKQKKEGRYYVLVEFPSGSYLSSGVGIITSNRYQSEKLLEFFNSINLERWKEKIE